MNAEALRKRFRETAFEHIPLPAAGATPARLNRLFEVGKEDLSLAKLAEAHWDAVAILTEAERWPEPNATYAVWASEIPGEGLSLTKSGDTYLLNGRKPFCSGLGIVDRALVTVREPHPLLLDLDLREQKECIHIDTGMWATEAFRNTETGAITFENFAVTDDAIVGEQNFYLSRPGFWHGACGPAACWAGGAAGLVLFAKQSKRDDPHTFSHLGAMDACVWAMRAALHCAGKEIDSDAEDDPMIRALRLRHVIEQGCTEILRRFTRAYGPHPLAMIADISRRYQELDLYLRQSHAERDLESLGRICRNV